MRRQLTHRKPLYQLPPEALESLRLLPPLSRRTGTHALRLIGQWCVDQATDGRVSLADLRELHDFSAWRVMYRYVCLFVAAGLLIDLGQGDYILEHFDSYHAPGWLQEQRILERRSKTRERVAALRLARGARQNVENSRGYVACTPITRSRSGSDPEVTNQTPQLDRETRCVSSREDESDAAFFARLAAMATGTPAPQPEPAAPGPSASPEPARRPSPEPARPSPEARRPKSVPRRPARMPKEQRPIHEGDVAAAAKTLELELGRVPELHIELAKMGATDADVGYALRAIKHATGKVRHRDRYLIGVIRRQQQHRLAAAGLQSVGS